MPIPTMTGGQTHLVCPYFQSLRKRYANRKGYHSAIEYNEYMTVLADRMGRRAWMDTQGNDVAEREAERAFKFVHNIQAPLFLNIIAFLDKARFWYFQFSR